MFPGLEVKSCQFGLTHPLPLEKIYQTEGLELLGQQ